MKEVEKVNEKIPVAEFKTIRAESIKHIHSDTITLGKYRLTVNSDGTLDDAVKSGNRIRFSHNLTAYGNCALKNEWQYLKDTFGYTRLKKIGDFCYAK